MPAITWWHDTGQNYPYMLCSPLLNSSPLFFFFNYFRCEVGTENWTQCNDHPIKICKYPVPGLFEGHSYYFRVRAVNSHGISKPSRMSDPIAALDPTEFERLHGGFSWISKEKCLDACLNGFKVMISDFVFYQKCLFSYFHQLNSVVIKLLIEHIHILLKTTTEYMLMIVVCTIYFCCKEVMFIM